jgi:hypothetical protein
MNYYRNMKSMMKGFRFFFLFSLSVAAAAVTKGQIKSTVARPPFIDSIVQLDYLGKGLLFAGISISPYYFITTLEKNVLLGDTSVKTLPPQLLDSAVAVTLPVTDTLKHTIALDDSAKTKLHYLSTNIVFAAPPTPDTFHTNITDDNFLKALAPYLPDSLPVAKLLVRDTIKNIVVTDSLARPVTMYASDSPVVKLLVTDIQSNIVAATALTKPATLHLPDSNVVVHTPFMDTVKSVRATDTEVILHTSAKANENVSAPIQIDSAVANINGLIAKPAVVDSAKATPAVVLVDSLTNTILPATVEWYPSPAAAVSTAYLRFNATYKGAADLSITDEDGLQVVYMRLSVNKGYNTIPVKQYYLAPGGDYQVSFFNVVTGEQIGTTQKITR